MEETILNTKNKQLSNPFSTGSGGAHFEAHVQASFVTLMLSGGYAPCFPGWSITEIKLQGKVDRYDTDDLIVFVEKRDAREKRKLLGQIKHSIGITHRDSVFAEVIQAAWTDFNNPGIFTRGRDVIALITGPLSATDHHNVQWLLNQARHTKSVDEFFRNVEQANFSPPKSSEKLRVFQHHLKAANKGIDVSREDLFEFLNSFQLLGYDLGKEVGVVLSLLHSHISQFNQQYPIWLWSRVVDVVQTWNQNAGTITPDRLPEDLIEAFRRPTATQIPKELTLAKPESEQVKTNWLQHENASVVALANLAGSWSETNQADIAVVSRLLGEQYATWVTKARDILLLPDSPISLKNGQWRFNDRSEAWELFGSRILDQDLDAFKTISVEILTEVDPSFELPVDKRFAANVYGKVLSHSASLRKGVAESLAIIGSKPEALVNCSRGRPGSVAVLAIREILADADWVLWGSLNPLLPLLAEAAPDEFLVAVEKALRLTPSPFDELFAQEGDGVSGANYLTGLLWALESLAWDQNYLVRVCVVLGELASHDPGGKWANRPANSLTTILLPWLPQTLASVEKRKVAIQTLCNEWPDIGWAVVTSLLPNQHQSSSGSHKPVWRNRIPEGQPKGASTKEYWEQVSFLGELAVSLAGLDVVRLTDLIDRFDNLPGASFDQLLAVLSSDDIRSVDEDKRKILWDRLTRFASKHRRYSDANWALSGDLVSKIEDVAQRLEPSNPLNLHRRLFSEDDFDLYDENGDWEEQRLRLERRRQDAVSEVLERDGMPAVVALASSVTWPRVVGYALGSIDKSNVDSFVLPDFLDSEDRALSSLCEGFVSGRYRLKGWQWVDSLDRSTWSGQQTVSFLTDLPFVEDTWSRAGAWLGETHGSYWQRVSVNPYQADAGLESAIDRLIEFGRPYAAIDCLHSLRHRKRPINGACPEFCV